MIFAIGLCFSMTIVYLYCAVQRLSLKRKLREEDNPILWANYLIYSRYHSDYHQEILTWVEEVLQYKVNQIGSKDPLLQKEFWYVLTFINCPYISSSVKTALENIVRPMATAAETNLANKIKEDNRRIFVAE